MDPDSSKHPSRVLKNVHIIASRSYRKDLIASGIEPSRISFSNSKPWSNGKTFSCPLYTTPTQNSLIEGTTLGDIIAKSFFEVGSECKLLKDRLDTIVLVPYKVYYVGKQVIKLPRRNEDVPSFIEQIRGRVLQVHTCLSIYSLFGTQVLGQSILEITQVKYQHNIPDGLNLQHLGGILLLALGPYIEDIEGCSRNYGGLPVERLKCFFDNMVSKTPCQNKSEIRTVNQSIREESIYGRYGLVGHLKEDDHLRQETPRVTSTKSKLSPFDDSHVFILSLNDKSNGPDFSMYTNNCMSRKGINLV